MKNKYSIKIDVQSLKEGKYLDLPSGKLASNKSFEGKLASMWFQFTKGIYHPLIIIDKNNSKLLAAKELKRVIYWKKFEEDEETEIYSNSFPNDTKSIFWLSSIIYITDGYFREVFESEDSDSLETSIYIYDEPSTKCDDTVDEIYFEDKLKPILSNYQLRGPLLSIEIPGNLRIELLNDSLIIRDPIIENLAFNAQSIFSLTEEYFKEQSKDFEYIFTKLKCAYIELLDSNLIHKHEKNIWKKYFNSPKKYNFLELSPPIYVARFIIALVLKLNNFDLLFDPEKKKRKRNSFDFSNSNINSIMNDLSLILERLMKEIKHE